MIRMDIRIYSNIRIFVTPWFGLLQLPFYLRIAFDSISISSFIQLSLLPSSYLMIALHCISNPLFSLRVEFVSQASILHRHRQTIDHMRIHFDNHQQLMK